MTNEEIQQAADNYIGHPYEVDEGYDISGMRKAFIAGAEWKDEQFNAKKAELIDKACAWLEYMEGAELIFVKEEMIDEFRKVMNNDRR